MTMTNVGHVRQMSTYDYIYLLFTSIASITSITVTVQLVFVCLFAPQQSSTNINNAGHVLYQHLFHHDVLPSKCNRYTTAAGTTTGTRSDNGNGNCDTQTTTWQLRIAYQQATPLHQHGRAGE